MGLKEHGIPSEYAQYVKDQIIVNNPGLVKRLTEF
jgi:hypothetical protein